MKSNISLRVLSHDIKSKYNIPSKQSAQEKEDKKYDDYSKKLYGKRSCVFLEISQGIFQQRFLDERQNNIIYKSDFYNLIPNLIQENYTVIIVETTTKNYKEIVAIHLPSTFKKVANKEN